MVTVEDSFSDYSDSEEFRDGIGDKLSSTIQNLSTFIAGFIVGFIKGPLLTLVILCFVPPMVISASCIKVGRWLV